jgi:hypothetical protein
MAFENPVFRRRKYFVALYYYYYYHYFVIVNVYQVCNKQTNITALTFVRYCTSAACFDPAGWWSSNFCREYISRIRIIF